MVVSYTNNYGYTDPYKQINNLTTNGDGGGNGGGGAFMKMFEEQEEESKKEKDLSTSSNPLDDLYNAPQGYYASPNVIRDYIDNSLLLNTEQVACTNITQHIALKSNVKETLKFLNTQAAKTMVNSKKRNYNFQTVPQQQASLPKTSVETSIGPNFFETRPANFNPNFFIN